MNVKSLRERAKLTQAELASKLGVCQSTVSMWENGTNSPKSSMLIPLANALSCSVEEILKGNEEMEITIKGEEKENVFKS